MFDVGFAELFLLAVIGLLVLGPHRLPAVARTLGSLMQKARRSWMSLQHSLEAELNAAELKKPLDDARRELDEVVNPTKDEPPRPEEHRD